MAVKSYDEYYKKQLSEEQKNAATRVAEYQNENNKITDEYISSVGKAYELSRDKQEAETNAEIAKIQQDYQSAYDANAVNAKLQERQIAENMANMGITNSGLNRTQQTAVRVAEMNSNAALQQQATAVKNSLIQQLDAFNKESQIQQLNEENSIKYNANQQNLSYKTSADENAENYARSVAQNLYNTDVEAETEKQKAYAEAQTAQQKAYYNYLTKSASTSASQSKTTYTNAYNALKQLSSSGIMTDAQVENAKEVIAQYVIDTNDTAGAKNLLAASGLDMSLQDVLGKYSLGVDDATGEIVEGAVTEPTETENTKKFRASAMTLQEAKQRGITQKEWTAYIEQKLNQANLTASEFKYLEELYGI